ncbi:MAG: NAD(P)-dependent alcohol dehydrogenase [Chthoniobacteraceae bacterium]
MITIQAALARDPGSARAFRMEPVGLDAPRPGELLVRIAACGICHTDIGFAGSSSGGLPQILGHEGAGVVEQTGARVRGLRPGDHVVLSYQSCGRCAACRRGSPAHCARFWELNFDGERLDGSNAYHGARGHFFGQSSFATYALATPRNTVKVPKTLPLELLAPLGCGFQTGAGTILNSLRVRRGSSVAIFGAGSVGLAAVMAARIARAGVIIAVDLRPARLRLARELGATHALLSNGRLAGALRKIVPGGVDYALEITGEPGVFDVAIETLAPGGALANIAVPGADASRLQPGQRMVEIIQGDAVPQVFIPKMIRYYQAGRFPIDRLIRVYPFSEINRAFADSESGRAIKAVLRMD